MLMIAILHPMVGPQEVDKLVVQQGLFILKKILMKR
jgi:hypothetical protein